MIAAWSEFQTDGTERVFIAPFEPDGERVDRKAVAVPFRGHPQRYPSIAFDGMSFLLVWVDGTSVLAARYSIAGERLDEPFVLGDDARTGKTALAWSGLSWIAVWSESDRNLHMRRIASSGALLDPADLRFPQTPASRRDRVPVIDCRDGTCLLAWLAEIAQCQITCPPLPPSVRAMRISPELERLDPEPLPIAWEGGPLSITSRNGEWLVTWGQPGGRRVDRAGRILDPEVPHAPDYYVPFAPVSAVTSFPRRRGGSSHGTSADRTGFSP